MRTTQPIQFRRLTLLLATLSAGLATLLFLIAIPISDALNREFRIDDDWSWLTLPIGIVSGLLLGIAYRNQFWLKPMAVTLGILLFCLIVKLSIPVQIPESVPDGMNRLPYGISQLIRYALLSVVLVTTAISGLTSLVIATVLVAIERGATRNLLSNKT